MKTTFSVCPVCKKRLPAAYVEEGGDIYLRKTCPEHGDFSVIAWRGAESFYRWAPEAADGGNDNCPYECGLCASHLRKTCCAILDVTARCNLRCNFCFAAAAGQGADPSFDELALSLREMREKGISFLHLSGGEPTVRDDVPELAAYARSIGFEYIQLNTNGLRIAQENGYAAALAASGVSTVFLQFDGASDDIYRAIRGVPLLRQKELCIERCGQANLGVVLVPTVVRQINGGHIGEIVLFAAGRAPAVKGIHFQPVTYFGRYPQPPADEDRTTLPDLMRALNEQTQGMISLADFAPSCCDHPLCGFHAEYLAENGVLRLAGRVRNGAMLQPQCAEEAVRKSQSYVKARWTRSCCPGAAKPDLATIDGFLAYYAQHSFSVSCMAFQDDYNVDLDRLRHCSVHVYRGGRVIPFCAGHAAGAL